MCTCRVFVCVCEVSMWNVLGIDFFLNPVLFGGYGKNVTFSLYETMHLIRFLIRIRLIPVFFKWLQLLLTKRKIKYCTVLCACIQNRHSVTARNDAVSIWICSQRRISKNFCCCSSAFEIPSTNSVVYTCYMMAYVYSTMNIPT